MLLLRLLFVFLLCTAVLTTRYGDKPSDAVGKKGCPVAPKKPEKDPCKDPCNEKKSPPPSTGRGNSAPCAKYGVPCAKKGKKESGKSGEKSSVSLTGFDQCCSYPCQNKGVCMSDGDSYSCDCTRTGYSGKNCENPSFCQRIKNIFSLSLDTKHKIKSSCSFLWEIVNSIPFLHRKAMKMVYLSRSKMVSSPPNYIPIYPFTTLDAYFNESYYVRAIPPIPPNCPKPMGIAGPSELPSTDSIFERIFLQKEFKPCNKLSNQLFTTWMHHFLNQLCKTDYQIGTALTWGRHGVDSSQIYGKNENARRVLRTGQGGKLKTQTINGEEFPPDLKDAPVEVHYPSIEQMNALMFDCLKPNNWTAPKQKFALGHKHLNLYPMMFAVATIWLREHNRICDILEKEYPSWTDDQLYEIARLIVTGIQIKIAMTEFPQHYTQYYFHFVYDPTLAHSSKIQYYNRVNEELVHLSQWHSMVAPSITIDGKSYNLTDMLYSDHEIVFKYGMDKFFDALVQNQAGEMTYQNYQPFFKKMVDIKIMGERINRMPPLNTYRRYFGLKPYGSFLELTGDPDLAVDLEALYQDVDAVEFFPGIVAEHQGKSIGGATAVILGGAWTIKGLMGNPLSSPQWWKPGVFGGQVGMDMVTQSTVHDVICRNLKNKCSGSIMKFTVTKVASTKKICPKIKCCCKPRHKKSDK